VAQLDIAVEHGQTAEAARANFERAIDAARSRYGRQVRRSEWSPDRTVVDVSGAGFDVRLSYDHRKVYAHGTIPIAFKRLKAPIQAFIAWALK